MSDPTSHPTTELDVDWHSVRRTIRGTIRGQLGSVEPVLIEDLTQQALIGVLRALRRETVRNVDSLASTIARATAIDEVRRLQRERRRMTEYEHVAPRAGEGRRSGSRFVHQLDLLWFLLCDYLRTQQASCQSLAELYAERGDWRLVAQTLGSTHDAIRKQWSRCTRALRAALAREPEAFEEWLGDD